MKNEMDYLDNMKAKNANGTVHVFPPAIKTFRTHASNLRRYSF